MLMGWTNPCKTRGRIRNLVGCSPKVRSIRGACPKTFMVLPAAAVPTDNWGTGSSWSCQIPRAAMVFGEMTLANVFPLSMYAAVRIGPIFTGT